MPLVVVSTYPVAGDTAVSQAVENIQVTFSKTMMTGKMYSWVMVSKDSFPVKTTEPYWSEDGRTCILPVALERGRAYAIWINSSDYNSFRDEDSHPAVPYLLVFETAR